MMRRERKGSPGTGFIFPWFLLFLCCVDAQSGADSDPDGNFSTNTTWSISDPRTLVGSLTLENEINATALLITHIVYKSFYTNMNSWSFLCFVKTSSNEYFLSVVVSGTIIEAEGEVVWTANSDEPVSQNAVLQLQPDGNMVLSDSNPGGSGSRAVWSTGTAGESIQGGKLLGGGVLEVNNGSAALWRSSDHPTDTLLLGQSLRVGDKLQSRSSPYNLTLGTYSLKVEPGGLGLYLNDTNLEPELYWLWNVYNNSALTLDYLGTSCSDSSFNVSIEWPKMGLNFENTSDLCNGSSLSQYYYLQSIKNETNSNLSTYFVFVRLDYDGNLRGYASGVASPLYQAMTKCQLPSSCGKYGVCTEAETCTCPINDTHHLSRDSNGDCGPVQSPNCSNIVGGWQMFALAGFEYYRNRYAVPVTMSSKEDCSDFCLRNCSCRASFYLAESNSCFAVSSPLGTLAQTANLNHSAFIKVQGTDLVKNSRPSGHSHKTAVIVVAVCVFIVGLVIAWFYPFKACRNSKPEITNPATGSHRVMSSIPDLTARKFSFNEIQKITRRFNRVLGSGGFGTVYEGLLGNGTKVAVKRLEIARQGEKEFFSEVAILSIIHHWNLVQLLGFCSQKSHRILVYEHMANGSLDQWLFDENKKRFLTWPIRFNIVLGTARGLAYLHHECRYKIIHLDVKPQNILLDDNFVAKVSDFGMATLMTRKESRVMTAMRGTPGYLAPEWLLECAITEKSDVYSFGMVLLEIIAGRKNYNLQVVDSEKCYFPAWALSMASSGRELEVIDPKVEDELDRSQAIRVLKIGFLCIQEDAHSRPSMGMVVQMLEGEKEVPEPPLQQSFQFGIADKISLPALSITSADQTSPSQYSSSSFGLPI